MPGSDSPITDQSKTLKIGVYSTRWELCTLWHCAYR